MMPKVWRLFLVRHLLLLIAGTSIGAIYDKPLLGLLIVLLLVLSWNLFWLFRFFTWVNGENMEYLPEGNGVWAQVFARVGFLRARSRKQIPAQNQQQYY